MELTALGRTVLAGLGLPSDRIRGCYYVNSFSISSSNIASFVPEPKATENKAWHERSLLMEC